MASIVPEPVEPFESWLLRRVAQAVEADEVPADLLAELQAEFKAAKDRPQQESHTAAIQHVANLACVPETEARSILEAIDAMPMAMRHLVLRRFAVAWLEGQRQHVQNRMYF